ncbi:MAG: alkaline phosphatase [Armatimonadetes bacterium]|nr:alkaline phosphatase [Armatimonadota bacterium]
MMTRRTRVALPALLAVLLASLASGQTRPKNVIIMISDGCGFNQIDAAGLWANGALDREVYRQSGWTRLAMSTYSADGTGYDPTRFWADAEYAKQNSTDSAASATAMATGTKTYNGAIGVGLDKKPLVNLCQVAEKLGKASGVITSVPLSHATPAGFLAHNAGRGSYAEIAREMIDESAADVVMGAGSPLFDDNGKTREKPDYQYVGGDKTWAQLRAGRAGGDADADGKPDPWTLIESKQQFEDLASGNLRAKRLFGVPQVATTLQEGRAKGAPRNDNVPTLGVMAQGALNVLSADPDGFFLMIEGGAIDWAGHSNLLDRSVEEETEFNQAAEAVVKWVEAHGGWEQNLVIVTGDHETGYLCAPKPEGGKPNAGTRLTGNGKGQLPNAEWNYKSHTNSLLPFAARGVGADRLAQMAVLNDPVRGRYLDNTDMPNTVRELWGLGQAEPAGNKPPAVKSAATKAAEKAAADKAAADKAAADKTK